MKTTLCVLFALCSSPILAHADEVVKTYPPGSAKDLLDKGDKDPKNPVGQAGGAMFVDEACAKKFKTTKGPNYEKCVKDKVEASQKKNTVPN